MSTSVRPGRGGVDRTIDWWYGRSPALRLLLRWTLIAGLTVWAFRESLRDLLHTTAAGGLVGFVWLLLPAAAVAATGIDLRRRPGPPIHDRQTDIITGTMCLVLAIVVEGVLVPRYAEYFHLLRLDLLSIWLFVLGAAVVLFGLRPVSRYGWVWLMLAFAFLLPYQTMVIALGGGRFAAGLAALVVAATAAAIAVGRTRRRAVLGAVLTFLGGLAVLIILTSLVDGVPLLVCQLLPGTAAMVVVCGLFLIGARRHRPELTLVHHLGPLAAGQVWGAIPLVVVVAFVLALIPLPEQRSATDISRPAPDELSPGTGLSAPPGWRVTGVEDFPVQGFYGDGAVLVRQRMVAEVGDPRFDKLSAPRTLMVDSIVSRQPFSFDAYPGHISYDTSGARLSRPRSVDLGHEVTAKLISAIDDRLLVTWDVLRFAWGSADEDQLVQIFAVDNHLPDAPFPMPGHGLPSTLRTLFTVLFRGNTVAAQQDPLFKDAELLTEFGRALVQTQLDEAGSAR